MNTTHTVQNTHVTCTLTKWGHLYTCNTHATQTWHLYGVYVTNSRHVTQLWCLHYTNMRVVTDTAHMRLMLDECNSFTNTISLHKHDPYLTLFTQMCLTAMFSKVTQTQLLHKLLHTWHTYSTSRTHSTDVIKPVRTSFRSWPVQLQIF